jgi:hypothetical protein
MTEQWSVQRRRVAVAMAIATAVCLGSTMLLIALSPADRVAELTSLRLGEGLAFSLAWMSFSVVGAIVVRHQPGNLVGWLCCFNGLQVSFVALTVGIATFNLAADPRSPVGLAAAWLSHAGSLTIFTLPLFIFLRFPTGRSLGDGWRRVEALVLVYVGAFGLLAAIEPMPLLAFPTTPNPFAIGDSPRIGAFGFAILALPLVALVTSSLVVRYRQGSPLERRQLRWLGVACVLVGFAMLSMTVTSPELASKGRLSTITAVVNAIAFSSIPVAIGIAIVRDRLYDIDRLFKRTLVYALVSGILALVYAVAVVGLSAPLTALLPTAGNTLATAASTLLVAALFRPVRSRAQVAVDRRFDRERHEATTTVEAFSRRVRAEVELDAIVGQLLGSAGRVVHPSSSGYWLRARGSAGRALIGSPGRR